MAVGYGAAWVIVQKYGAGQLALVRVDASTLDALDVAAAGQSEAVALGAGSVWAANCARPVADDDCDLAEVVRIDPATLETQATLTVPGRNLGEIAFGQGSVWVSTYVKRVWTLFRIDPQTGRVIASSKGCCSDLSAGEASSGASTVWTAGRSSRSTPPRTP
jgi:hypothetical protein